MKTYPLLSEVQADNQSLVARLSGLIAYTIQEPDGTYTVITREPTAAEIRRGQ